MTTWQKSSVHIEEIRLDYDTDSPPYSPTASEMERPSFHPQILYDLRVACAHLVNQTNPPDPDDEADLQETLRNVEAERKAKYVAQAQAAEARSQKATVRELKAKPRKEEMPMPKGQPKRYSSARPREDVRKPEQASFEAQPVMQQHYVPKHETSSTGLRKISQTIAKLPGKEKVESVPIEGPSRPREQRRDNEDEALNEIRRSIHARPKTSAAACVDYDGPIADDSSKSTSRSTSNFDAVHRPISTNLTSLAQTPSEEKRRSHLRRPSDESYQEELAREKAEWLQKQHAQQEAAEQHANSGRAARPASRTSKLSRMTSRSEWSDRPPSRAGSIASSIADGISNYIRPRTGSEGFRSGRSSATGLSRSHSRSSSLSRRSSSGFWRRNSLRRKGSWASFRSGRPDYEDKGSKKNGEPNLNRPLPALPGLDQYKETKKHIGQMMKGGTRKNKASKISISEPQPLMDPETQYTATLPKPNTPILDRQMQLEDEDRAYQAQVQLFYEQQKREHGHRHESRQESSQRHKDHRSHPRRSTVPKNMESSERSSKDKEKHEKRQSKQQKPPRRSTAPALANPSERNRHSRQIQQAYYASDSRQGSLSKSPTQTFHPFGNCGFPPL